MRKPKIIPIEDAKVDLGCSTFVNSAEKELFAFALPCTACLAQAKFVIRSRTGFVNCSQSNGALKSEFLIGVE